MNAAALRYRRGRLEILDQRRLPHRVLWITCRSASDVARAIREMVVRGAPAIGIAAAYGLALEAKRGSASIEWAAARLVAARPTAVNLRWAIERMKKAATRHPVDRRGVPDRRAFQARLLAEARRIHAEDIAMNRRIARFGARLLPRRSSVLTHCNTGALATGGIGTAFGILAAGHRAGRIRRVLVDETRPYLQGARLTAWECRQARIPHALICDSAAGALMARGEVQAVVVGADRIAANGDVANKVGTYSLAVLARAHRIPFYVAAPWTTVDLATPGGARIPIEQRAAEEVTHHAGRLVAPHGTKAINPAFDITPGRLVTAIVTDRGVARSSYRQNLRRLTRRGRPSGRPGRA